MECGRVPVAAVAETHARRVADQVQVGDRADPEVVQAGRDEDVLAPGVPVQLAPAALRAPEVRGHRPAREGLERPVHLGPAGALVRAAVLHVHALVRVRRQVVPEPGGQHDGVGVDLERPVVLQVEGALFDGLPGIHEEQRVRGRPVARDAHRRLREGHGVDRAVGALAQCERGVAQDGKVVAIEYTHSSFQLDFQQGWFVARRPYDREAEKRRHAAGPCRARGRAERGVLVIPVQDGLDVLEV
mmetsp:Transcript_10081/g.28389  ORF Transcript_10081/g.28389 Transcript_10081/m.28389 type:complete len:244 (+) Transcript_10081:201-932(+)